MTEQNVLILGAIECQSQEAYKTKYYAGSTSVWMLGVVLYEMVHGSLPFPDSEPCAKCFRINNPNLSEGEWNIQSL